MHINCKQDLRQITKACTILAVSAIMVVGTNKIVNPATKDLVVFAVNQSDSYTSDESIECSSSFESNSYDNYRYAKTEQNIAASVSMSSDLIITDNKNENSAPIKENVQINQDTTHNSDAYTLNAYHGVYGGPSGKETYYNLPMGGVVRIMRRMGYSEQDYPYWVRDDGVKMFGDYIMVAADLNIRPKGTILECSLGTAMVVDTGDFAQTNHTQLDIATAW